MLLQRIRTPSFATVFFLPLVFLLLGSWGATAATLPAGDERDPEDVSPFYYNTEDLASIQAVGLAAAFLSACAGHANTVAFALRPIALLDMCKPASSDPHAVLLMPMVVAIGDDPNTAYYAGVALLDLPLMAGIVVLALLVAVGISLSTDLSIRQALRRARFPSLLAAPYMYLSYQSLFGTIALLSTSSSEGTLTLGAVVVFAVWAALLVPVAWVVFLRLPRSAVFVENFAEVSHKGRHKRRRLIDHVNAYISKLDAREAAKEAAPSPTAADGGEGGGEEGVSAEAEGGQSGRHQSAADDGAASEAPTAGIQSLISTVVSRMRQWGNISVEAVLDGVAGNGGAAPVLDSGRYALQRQNAHYSRRLAEQLMALDRKYLELTDLLAGPHRWEDKVPDVRDVPLPVREAGDGEENDVKGSGEPKRKIRKRRGSNDDEEMGVVSASQKGRRGGEAAADEKARRSLVAATEATDFVQSMGIFFEAYRRPWFLFVEIAMCWVCGAVHGYRPSSDAPSACVPPAVALVVACAAYYALLLFVSVHVSWFEDYLVKVIAFVQTLGALVALVAIGAPGEATEQAAYLIALLSMYIVILKGLLHGYEILSWFIAAPGTPWGSIEDYCKHYKAMRRKNMVSKAALRARFVVVDEGAAAAADDGDGKDLNGKDKDRATVRSAPSRYGRFGDEAIKYDLVHEEVIGEDAAHYDAVGGRTNAFVTSRGVPLSLLPFRLAPLPQYAPLPARTRTLEEGLRAHKKRSMLEARKKRLWDQVRHLFSDEEARRGYEGREVGELQRLAEMSRRMGDHSAEAADRRRREAEAEADGDAAALWAPDGPFGDVRERMDLEARRNEDIDEARRAVVRAKIASSGAAFGFGDDHWRLQEAVEGTDFYNDGDDSHPLRGTLFSGGNVFGRPLEATITNRSMCFPPSAAAAAANGGRSAAGYGDNSRRTTAAALSRRGGRPPVSNASIHYNAVDNSSIFDLALRGNASIYSDPDSFARSGASGLGDTVRSTASSSPTRSRGGGAVNDESSVVATSPSLVGLSRSANPPMGPAPISAAAASSHHHHHHRSAFGSEVLTRLADIKRSSAALRQAGREAAARLNMGGMRSAPQPHTPATPAPASPSQQPPSRPRVELPTAAPGDSFMGPLSPSSAPPAPLAEEYEYDLL